MTRLIDSIQQELAVLEAVMSYRTRSFILLMVGLLIGPLLGLLALPLLQSSALPGLEQAMRPVVGMVALVLTLKFLFLALQTYLKDRAALLRL